MNASPIVALLKHTDRTKRKIITEKILLSQQAKLIFFSSYREASSDISFSLNKRVWIFLVNFCELHVFLNRWAGCFKSIFLQIKFVWFNMDLPCNVLIMSKLLGDRNL